MNEGLSADIGPPLPPEGMQREYAVPSMAGPKGSGPSREAMHATLLHLSTLEGIGINRAELALATYVKGVAAKCLRGKMGS